MQQEVTALTFLKPRIHVRKYMSTSPLIKPMVDAGYSAVLSDSCSAFHVFA
jgi:hypothetical protein